MDDSDELESAAGGSLAGRWEVRSAARERTAVQRSVARLLDALAPDRVVTRSAPVPVPIDRYRTRRGCILQGPTAAVSVSWFPDEAQDAAAGELHVAAWRGVVSHPGSARRVPGAAVVRELVLRPADRGAEAWAWRASDGTLYDTEALVTLCLALLATQASADAPDGHD